MEVSEVHLESVFHLPSPHPVGRHNCAYSEKGEVLMPSRQRHYVSGRLPMPFKEPHTNKASLEFRRACWGLLQHAGTLPSSAPRHRLVSPEEQMTEWEGRRGRRTESTEAPTCASPCAGEQSACSHRSRCRGSGKQGISTWSLALERPLSPPIWGALGHPRSEGACNSGLTTSSTHALAHTRDGPGQHPVSRGAGTFPGA